jgi:hypothetical protein
VVVVVSNWTVKLELLVVSPKVFPCAVTVLLAFTAAMAFDSSADTPEGGVPSI